MDKIEITGQYITNACSNFVTKCIGVLSMYLIQFSFGDISHMVLSALFMLILIDFLTGIWASKMVGEEIKSAKIFRTAWKFALYFTVVSSGHFTEVVVGSNMFLDETIMGFLALTELYSIFENMKKAGYETPTELLKNISSLIKKK